MTIRLILELIDEQTGCPTKNFAIDADDAATIAALLEEESLDPRFEYDLEPHETVKFLSHFGFEIDTPAPATLRPRHNLDERPYQIHTNRELLLMLEGTKPLAAFGEAYPLSGVRKQAKNINEKTLDAADDCLRDPGCVGWILFPRAESAHYAIWVGQDGVDSTRGLLRARSRGTRLLHSSGDVCTDPLRRPCSGRCAVDAS